MNKTVFKICISICLFTTSCNETDNDIQYSSIRGVFKCHENSVHSGFRSYLVEFDAVKGQESQYIILNFHNTGLENFIYATFQGDSLIIENQLIQNYFVNGSGSVSEDFRNIHLFYIMDDGRNQLEYYKEIFR